MARDREREVKMKKKFSRILEKRESRWSLVAATCDWASAVWLQQHSESAFFGTLYTYCQLVPHNFHFLPQQSKVLNLLENIFYSIFCTVDFSLARGDIQTFQDLGRHSQEELQYPTLGLKPALIFSQQEILTFHFTVLYVLHLTKKFSPSSFHLIR